ncbi:MAG: nuclear transport factor 2 family protein [Pseudomonadota bacterium]
MPILPAPVAAYLAAYNTRDVPAMLAGLDRDITFQDLAGDCVTAEATGLAAFEELARAGVAAFATRHQAVRHAITVADTTLAEIDFTGTLRIDLPGLGAAGETVNISGATLFRLAGGKITRIVDQHP